jgi:hypothetical protein
VDGAGRVAAAPAKAKRPPGLPEGVSYYVKSDYSGRSAREETASAAFSPVWP